MPEVDTKSGGTPENQDAGYGIGKKQAIMTDEAAYGFWKTNGDAPIVERREFVMETTDTVDLFANEIVFVLDGSIHVVRRNDHLACTLSAGEFAFFPVDSRMSRRAATGSEILIVRLTGQIPTWYVSRINRISDILKSDRKDHRQIRTLTMNESMRGAVDGVRTALTNGITDKIYLDLKVSEILFLIHACYSQEECIEFFSFIVSPNFLFSEFVRQNWMKYPGVYKLADALNMSRQQFTARFRTVFGTTTREWLQRKKLQRIYDELCNDGDKPLKEIAEEYGFSSWSSFSRYCYNSLGATPGRIRTGRRIGSSQEKVPGKEAT